MKQHGMTNKYFIATFCAGTLLISSTIYAGDTLQSKTSYTYDDQIQLVLDDASLTFINESFDGDTSVGVLEQGRVNLDSLYRQEATALEIYLAYQPKEKPPQFLIDEHLKTAELSDTVPFQPRNLTELVANNVTMAPGYYGFKKDTNNCWGWGGVSNYDSVVGSDPDSYGGHSGTASLAEFTNWSMITGTSVMKGEFTSNATYFDEYANTQKSYATGFAHERAFAMCVTYAEINPNHHPSECSLNDGVSENSVRYRLRIFVESAAGSSWNSDLIYLENYGEGARYRSSSNTKRRYELQVEDVSLHSSACQERYDLFWRAKTHIGTSGSYEIGELTK